MFSIYIFCWLALPGRAEAVQVVVLPCLAGIFDLLKKSVDIGTHPVLFYPCRKGTHPSSQTEEERTMPCYLIMIFNENDTLIHCHTFKGWYEDAKENAEQSCKFHNGSRYEFDEVSA